VLIVEVIPGGPADQAGLQGGNEEVVFGGLKLRIGGDIITAIGKSEVSDMKGLARLLNKSKVGQTITVQIFRDNQPQKHQVLLAERPSGF
jgi:S1-C subfamily serine protease